MRRRILAVVLILGLASAAQALLREWGPWKPGERLSSSTWAEGVVALVNRKERVGGYMLNGFNRFRYRGDAKALNAFLADVVKVRGPKTIYLLGADQQVGLINPRYENTDWTMSLSINGHVGVMLDAEGAIKTAELKLPAGVSVERVPKAP